MDAENQTVSTTAKELERLRARREEHFVLGSAILGSKGTALYKLDLLAIAVLDRSLALLRGFCDLVEGRNMISAAPLLRCQLDNGLRFFASTLVENPHDFALEVHKGTPISRLKDRSGKRMRDAYLVEKLTAEVPWVESLYKQASGYVHLSEQHVFNSIGIPDEDAMTTIKITGHDGSVWTEERYLEAIEAFDFSTRLVLELVQGWSQARSQQANVAICYGQPQRTPEA